MTAGALSVAGSFVASSRRALVARMRDREQGELERGFADLVAIVG